MIEKDLKYYESLHNSKFPDNLISVFKKEKRYLYFNTEFGICKGHASNVSRSPFTIKSALNKTEYLIKYLNKYCGNTYDYSNVKYEKTNNFKIKLTCKEHGDFQKSIQYFYKNKSNIHCPKCYKEYKPKYTKVKNIDIFKEKYYSKFPDSKVEILELIKSSHIKIKNQYGVCICLKQSLLLHGNVGINSAIDKNKYFANQAKEIHGDKYSYERVIWLNSKCNVEIHCNIHNEYFLQNSHSHLRGSGCKKCWLDKLSITNYQNSTGWTDIYWINKANKSKNFDSYKIYIIKCWNESEIFYKIGRTFQKTEKRLYGKKQMPYNYEILKEIEGESTDIFKLEKQLQKQNKRYKYVPEIHFHGKHECFSKLENYEIISA